MFTPLDFLPIEYVPAAFAQIQSIPSSDDGPQNPEIIIDAPIRCDEPRIGHAKKEISKSKDLHNRVIRWRMRLLKNLYMLQ